MGCFFAFIRKYFLTGQSIMMLLLLQTIALLHIFGSAEGFTVGTPAGGVFRIILGII